MKFSITFDMLNIIAILSTGLATTYFVAVSLLF